MSPQRALRPFLFLALIIIATPSRVRADEWLTFRHDPRRTGASSGRANIDRPTVTWRRYLGGQLGSTQYFSADVDGDRIQEVVYIAGGRAIAKRPDNVIVWESPLLALQWLGGVADLDNDGTPEILAVGASGRVVMLSGRDGQVAWLNPTGPIAEAASARIADLDGDGRLDLYIGECRCCTLHGTSIGVAYSFVGGYGASRQLWTLDPSASGCGAAGDQIADVDGDGINEIIVSSRTADMTVIDGRTGMARWRIAAPPSGGFYPGTDVYPVNLDGDPGRELIAVTSGYLATGALGARRIAMWDYDMASNAFVMRWEATSPDRANDAVNTLRDAIGDLDGDMVPEVVFGMTTAGAHRVELRNAVTGAVRAQRTGAQLVGAVDLDNDGRAEILLAEAGALNAYRIEVVAGFVRLWSLPMRSAVSYTDFDRFRSDPNARRTLALDLDDDPSLELIVSGTNAAGQPTLFAVNANTDPPTEIGRFSAPAGVTILSSAIALNLTRMFPQVMTVTSDGYLVVLDRTLRATNHIMDQEIELPGMRIGGYYSGPGGLGPTPAVAMLGTPAVIVRDSRPALTRLDATRATLAQGPSVTWERPGSAWPVIADLNGDGTRDLAVVEGADVVALDAATARTEIWRSPGAIGPVGIYADMLPASRGGQTDIFFPRANAGAVMQGVALNGSTGAVRWSPFTRALQWGYMLFAVADLTGDGLDDMLTVTNSTLVLSGSDGTLASDNNDFVAYADPMILDAAGTGAGTDAWVHGGYFADRLLSNTMTTRATRTDHTTPHSGAWGARVTCAGATAVVSGAYQSPHLWTTRVRDAAPIAHRVLASGEVYPPDAVSETATPGFLGNATSVVELRAGGPSVVLIGSTDGYLYAVDACTLARVWSLNLRYPVGEAVVADATGDGVDDVMVTSADGFLYGVGRAAIDAPMQVIDVDPPGGQPDTDVDMIDSANTLYARWTAVPGATSYEAGVFTASGSEARFPNFRNDGNVTTTVLDMLPLRQGQRYYVAIKPIGALGPGLEAQSNGVVVTDRLGPNATVTVSPMRAWPPAGVIPQIAVHCDDRVGLSAYALEVQRADGTTVAILEARSFSGPSHDGRSMWDGRNTSGAMAAAGDYRAHLTCTDLMMRVATSDSAFVLDATVTAMRDAGVMPRVDGGGDGGRTSGGGGCGCAVPGSGTTPLRGALFVAFAVLAGCLRRRRGAVSVHVGRARGIILTRTTDDGSFGLATARLGVLPFAVVATDHVTHLQSLPPGNAWSDVVDMPLIQLAPP